MAKTKTVWKVLRRRGDKRISAIVDRKRGGIEYSEPGKPTVAPEGTKLLAFSTRKAALSFWPFQPYEVWQAEAKDVRSIKELCDPFRPSKFVGFWGKHTGVGGWSFAIAPRGTVSCSELTLIKKVG